MLVLLSALFLRARRTEFNLAFAAYTGASGVLKFAYGVGLFHATDAATAAPWVDVGVVFFLMCNAAFIHSLVAFGRRNQGPLPLAVRAAIYAPFAVVCAWGLLEPGRLPGLGLPLLWVFTFTNLPFLWVAWRGLARARTSIERAEARYLLLYLGVTTPIVLEATIIWQAWGPIALWESSLAYTVATAIMLYGILRHEVFNVDVVAKRAVFYTRLTAGLALTFILLEQFVQQNVAVQGYEWVLAGVGSALMLAPLAYGARLAVDHVFPGAGGESTLRRRKLEVYRAQLEVALADGRLTEAEAVVLSKTRARLGITEDEHTHLQRELMPPA